MGASWLLILEVESQSSVSKFLTGPSVVKVVEGVSVMKGFFSDHHAKFWRGSLAHGFLPRSGFALKSSIRGSLASEGLAALSQDDDH